MSTVTVEQSKVSPPPHAAAEFSLPLVCFDMGCYGIPTIKRVLFYEFPCSKSQFLKNVVPNLKTSLSETLNHFLPLAGNIIHPLTSDDKPIIRYAAGDSVSFTVSVSNADFGHLSGHHPRESDEFHAFVPLLSPATHSEHSIACPILALQATLFPEHGLCIGFEAHHAVVDGRTLSSFMQAWGMICCSMYNNGGGSDGNDDIRLILNEAKCLPFYDRQSIMDINGLDSMVWDSIVKLSLSVVPPFPELPTNEIRTTLVLSRDEIHKLKNFVMANSIGDRDYNNYISSLTVACALVWSCLAKSVAAVGEAVADEELEYFSCPVDCRERLSPPLPDNYFGNCLTLVVAELKHGELTRDDGFVVAAKSLGKAIWDKVYGEKGILNGVELILSQKPLLVGKRAYGVTGSPRFSFYQVDYGWGKPKKFEYVHINGTRYISLSESREFKGGLEIGVSRPKPEMEAFMAVFNEVLTSSL